ncbi:hypothetical protein SLA2020_268920 [Shorea laevis]
MDTACLYSSVAPPASHLDQALINELLQVVFSNILQESMSRVLYETLHYLQVHQLPYRNLKVFGIYPKYKKHSFKHRGRSE